MVFNWSLRDNQSPQDYRTLLSILIDVNNALVLMVSTHPLISKSSRPCTERANYKSPQITKNLLSILGSFNSNVVLMDLILRDCSPGTNYNWHYRIVILMFDIVI